MKTGRRTPNAAQLANYDVENVEKLEGIWNPLYHYQAYAAAGQAQLTFFNAAAGQGGLTLDDTNMLTPGSMPAGQNFLCVGLEILFWPGTAPGSSGTTPVAAGFVAAMKSLNDIWTVAKSGRVRFFVGSKDYLCDGPIGVFPAQNGIEGSAALSGSTTADTNASIINVGAIRGPAYQITPIRLTSSLNFTAFIETNGVVALPSAVAGRIGVRLLGFQYRRSQ